MLFDTSPNITATDIVMVDALLSNNSKTNKNEAPIKQATILNEQRAKPLFDNEDFGIRNFLIGLATIIVLATGWLLFKINEHNKTIAKIERQKIEAAFRDSIDKMQAVGTADFSKLFENTTRLTSIPTGLFESCTVDTTSFKNSFSGSKLSTEK